MRILRTIAQGAIALSLLMPFPEAAAHWAESLAAPPAALPWSYEPWAIVPLCIVGLLWAAGFLRLGRRSYRAVVCWQNLSFASGWLVLGLSLASPLHAAGRQSFAWHMVEHELLILVAAPLLVVGRPAAVLLWGLPHGWRRAVACAVGEGWRGRAWHWLTRPVVASLGHGGLVWLWHLPRLFDAAVRSEAVHALQHLSFFLSAAIFWWAMFHVRERRQGIGVAVLAVFATAMHSTLLGALLTLLPSPRYAAYQTASFGLTPLEDQQLAGLVMWVPAGVVYVGLGLILFTLWLRGGDADERRRHVYAAG
jgi:cytochrome c oxidase assembly factor CtaG